VLSVDVLCNLFIYFFNSILVIYYNYLLVEYIGCAVINKECKNVTKTYNMNSTKSDDKSSEIGIYNNFLKIRPLVTINNTWKFTGSFNRNMSLYDKNINYVTDIDIINYTTIKKWEDVKPLLFTTNKEIVVTYSTCGINEKFVVDWDITNPHDLSNINFEKIQNKILTLYKNKDINDEIKNKWSDYVDSKTLKGLLLLENDMRNKSLIRWTVDELKNEYKIINDKKYDIKELYEKYSDKDDKDYRATLHWIWFYKDNIIPIDCSITLIDEGTDLKKYTPIGIKYVQEYNMMKFYKYLYIDYFLEDWFSLFRGLKRVARDLKMYDIYDEIEDVSERELALHKAILAKLKRLSLYMVQKTSDPPRNLLGDSRKDGEKKVTIDIFNNLQPMLKKIFDALIPLMKSIGYDTDQSSDNVSQVYKDFSAWLNNKIVPFYNEWRLKIIKRNHNIERKIPPAIY
jgi:hypothetical protein